MQNEDQNIPGPDDLGNDTDIATTQQNSTSDALGQVNDSDKDIPPTNEGEKVGHNTGDTGDPEE
ncbi:MAG: hypothetical protein U0X91_31780 [Spirosomataceae bacterium]